MKHHRFTHHAGAVLAVLLLSPAAFSQKRQDWDSLLERDEVNPPYDSGKYCSPPVKGWRTADGGFSAYHAATGKRFFHFGDTFFYDNWNGVQPNTMLVAAKHAWVNGPHLPPWEGVWGDDYNIEFWGRTGTTAWGEKQTCGLDSAQTNKAWMPIGSVYRWLWPNGHHVPLESGQTNKMLGFYSMMRCDNGAAYGADCNENKDEETGWIKVARSATHPTRLVIWQNVSDKVSTWPTSPPIYHIRRTNTASTINEGIEWGQAILQSPGSSTYYIFGVTLEAPSGGAFTSWDAKPLDVVIARATASTITDYNSWSFYMKKGSGGVWCTSASQCQTETGNTIPPASWSMLRPVANSAATHFTVDEVNFDGQLRFVMVQDRGELNNEWDRIAVRISNGSGTSATRIFKNITDSTQTWVGAVGNDAWSMDPPCDPIFDGKLTAYHGIGHWAFSNKPARKMLLSYYCPFVDHNKETGDDVSPLNCDVFNLAAYRRGDPDKESMSHWTGGRIRFWELDMTKLKPWCTSTSGCWM
jgi:hypothetical protein